MKVKGVSVTGLNKRQVSAMRRGKTFGQSHKIAMSKVGK